MRLLDSDPVEQALIEVFERPAIAIRRHPGTGSADASRAYCAATTAATPKPSGDTGPSAGSRTWTDCYRPCNLFAPAQRTLGRSLC